MARALSLCRLVGVEFLGEFLETVITVEEEFVGWTSPMRA
ncbi:hypothetical protein J3R74_000013 [Puniceicoccus vermicola]